MIIVKISGGLGNQLFQYAMAKAISLKLNRKLYIDRSWYNDVLLLEDYNDKNATTRREYLLNEFALKTKTKSDYYLNWIKRLQVYSKRSKLFRQLMNSILNKLAFKEFNYQNFSLDDIAISPQVILSGHWQNNKLIEDYKIDIIEELQLANNILESSIKILNEIENAHSVSIHFRRGDYLSKPNSSKLHATCSKEYYQTCIDKMDKLIDNPQYFIFSDEIEWVRTNMDLPQNAIFIDDNTQAHEHLHLMSCCKHQITANSTFSWWAAWMNKNSDKIVFTPKYWYYDNKLNNTIIRIPEEWIKINNLN